MTEKAGADAKFVNNARRLQAYLKAAALTTFLTTSPPIPLSFMFQYSSAIVSP